MKKRYYLRGLGMGILFTALFFMAGGKSKPAMSDEMIIERAKELGMIESTILADISGSSEMAETESDEEAVSMESTEETVSVAETIAETEETATDTETESVEETTSEDTESVENDEAETDSKEETIVEESTVEEPESSEEIIREEESSEAVTPGQMLTVVVNKGEGSDTVSHRLHEMGLVDDPYEFDRYLMQNGYDKRIGAGEHQIPVGASWQEIAKILTS